MEEGDQRTGNKRDDDTHAQVEKAITLVAIAKQADAVQTVTTHQGPGDAGKNTRPYHQVLTLLAAGRERGNHRPVGNVHDGVGHAPEDVGDGGVDVSGVAGKLVGTEDHQQHHRVDQGTDQNPRPELAKPGAGVIDDHAHHRVGEGIDHPRHQEQATNERGRQTDHVGVVIHQEDVDDGAGKVFAQGTQAIGGLGAQRNMLVVCSRSHSSYIR